METVPFEEALAELCALVTKNVVRNLSAETQTPEPSEAQGPQLYGNGHATARVFPTVEGGIVSMPWNVGKAPTLDADLGMQLCVSGYLWCISRVFLNALSSPGKKARL